MLKIDELTLLVSSKSSSKRSSMSLQTKFLRFCLFLLLAFSAALANQLYSEENPDSSIGYEEALLFGLVEGVTEFLPVSSTGHLILANEALGREAHSDKAGEDALNAYLIVIQAGAILAVGLLYAGQVVSVILGFAGRDPRGLKLGLNLLAAFLPAAFAGLFLNEMIKGILFGSFPVAIALILGAALMHGAERAKRRQERSMDASPGKSLESLSIYNALFIGLMQCVAMCPGTSRSMMTIVGGYFVGLTRSQAAEFSFLLGLVTLSAAAGYEIMTKGEVMLANLALGPMLFGCLIAGMSAALSVRWLVGYLSRRGLGLFVWYRLILGSLILIFLFGRDLHRFIQYS